MAIVNIPTHLFLIETEKLVLKCSKLNFDFGKSLFFLLTTKLKCFIHTPNEIPLRGHIRGALFGIDKKISGWN